MTLTNHQLLHVNAIIKDARQEGNEKALNDAENILRTELFPILLEISYIHDYLEKDSGGKKWQTH